MIAMMRMRPVGLLVGLGLLAASLGPVVSMAKAQPTRTDAEKDPVLKAMLTELDRSMSQLQLKGFSKPYFIQYRVEDMNDYLTKAEFGATEGAQHLHQRVVRVTVRVGDYKTDSSSARGDGVLRVAARDDDPIALRSSLWAATDQAYKAALAAYAQKQAALKQVQTPPQADDFSHETPVISLADPSRLKLDEDAWVSRVAHDSGIYRTEASVKAEQQDVEYSLAEFRGRAVTTWIVNSEGTIVRKGSEEYHEVVAVGTQAADGMRLDRSYGTTGSSLQGLDAPDVFAKHVVELIHSLEELRKAPLVEEEYHGPLLLSADASADTLKALLAGGVAATRPRLGTEARTNGPFASSYQTRVLPEFMDVVDDPGLKSYNGKGLAGAYSIDDEGVPAQAVQLVTAGRLVNYLIGREPVKDFPHSNGHGRAGLAGPPQPVIGVLKITAQNGLTDEALSQKLLALARDRGLKNAYSVATLGGVDSPRLLYRVSADGTRTLVRGAELDDIDQRALRSSVVAAGKDLWVDNSFGDPAQTVLAPALLLDDATVRRANQKNDKLPFYPPPE